MSMRIIGKAMVVVLIVVGCIIGAMIVAHLVADSGAMGSMRHSFYTFVGGDHV